MMSDHTAELNLTLDILKDLQISLRPDAKILDFGCGSGAAVYACLDRGFNNVYGYDIQNYLHLKNPEDKRRFLFSNEELKKHHGSFDYIFSNQVFEHVMDYPGTIQQTYDLLKPGGVCLHFFPSKWRLIEPHIYVPMAGAFSAKTYLGFWAMVGIRNEFQQGKIWQQVREQNTEFCKNNVNYLNSQEIYNFFSKVFERVEFREDLFIKHSPGRLHRYSKLFSMIPGFSYVVRNCHARAVFLQKTPKNRDESTLKQKRKS
jgi:SAM-dependent methyltransferase